MGGLVAGLVGCGAWRAAWRGVRCAYRWALAPCPLLVRPGAASGCSVLHRRGRVEEGGVIGQVKGREAQQGGVACAGC